MEPYGRLQALERELGQAEELLKEDGDGELRKLALEELERAKAERERLLEELRLLLIPEDPRDQKNAI